jgi:hypothetical protein
MPVGTAAVIEAFQPRMIYGTGFQVRVRVRGRGRHWLPGGTP